MAGLEIVVDGDWQSLDVGYGDEEMSTVWPGGSDELTWTPSTALLRRARGGEPVTAYYGGVPKWAGTMLEPDPSAGTLTAQGAYKDADGWPALDGSGNASAVPDTVIPAAVAAGLNWVFPASGIYGSAVNIDLTSGPTDVPTLLDTRANNNTLRWGVDPTRTVYMVADPTTPSLQITQRNGLGFDLTNYASTLVGRYRDSGTHTVATTSSADAAAAKLHGTRLKTVDLTPLGEITATKAQSILTSLLALGVSTPSWTAPIEVTYGEIQTIGDTPRALQSIAGGQMVRVHGGYDLASRLNGQTYLDVVIGQTRLAAGVLTIQPIGFVGRRTLEDALTETIAANARNRNR